jgi:signal transduction histidine kinase
MNRQINYKTMRVIVGAIALLLAPIACLLSDKGIPLSSISISYWTNSHDIFVGSLVAIGFFLVAYNGTGSRKDWEFYLSKASCIFATCIAFFPCKGFSKADTPPTWIASIANFFDVQPFQIHNGAAILLFACLIAMMWFFSNRAKQKGKTFRAYIYRTIGISMITGIIIFYIIGKILHLSNTVLLEEVWGLSLFGIGWLIAGSYKTDYSLEQ